MKKTCMSCALLSTILSALLLSGCSNLFKNASAFWAFPVSLQEVSISAAQNANGGYPVTVDLVLVRDTKIYDGLANLRATEWFAGKTDYLRQFQKKMTVLSWEIVPGQQLEHIPIQALDDAVVGVLVFADYPGAGSYRSLIQNQKNVAIYLMKNDFELKP